MHLDAIEAERSGDHAPNDELVDAGRIQEALEKMVGKGLDGVGPLMPARELAGKYEAKARLTPEDRIDRLVRTEARKTFGVGFVTGLGGFITMPIAIPAGIVGAGAFQSRMIGTVAELRGYDTDDPRVRALTMMCLFGEVASDTLKHYGMRSALEALDHLSRRMIDRIVLDLVQRGTLRTSTRVGSAALAKGGLPVVGGMVGGTVDYGITKGIGHHAARAFVPVG